MQVQAELKGGGSAVVVWVARVMPSQVTGWKSEVGLEMSWGKGLVLLESGPQF